MSRLKLYTDPFITAESQYKVASYLLKSEVRSWVEIECPDNHIFIHALLVANFVDLNKDSYPHQIYNLSLKLTHSFDEDVADKLIELVDNLPDDMDELFEYVDSNY